MWLESRFPRGGMQEERGFSFPVVLRGEERPEIREEKHTHT